MSSHKPENPTPLALQLAIASAHQSSTEGENQSGKTYKV